MDTYRSIHLLIRHGAALAFVVAAGVLVAGGALVLGIESQPFWIVVVIGAGVLAFYFVMLLRDIAKVIAETLIPMP